MPRNVPTKAKMRPTPENCSVQDLRRNKPIFRLADCWRHDASCSSGNAAQNNSVAHQEVVSVSQDFAKPGGASMQACSMSMNP